MKKALIYVCFQNLFFLILLFVSGFFGGIAGEVIYYLAFLVPFFVTFVCLKRDRLSCKPPKLAMKPYKALFALPLVAPTIAVILLISWISSMLFDGAATAEIPGNMFLAILTHALTVAIIEEAFFRYLPLAVLVPHSKKVAIFFSAFLFALAHMNPHQLPYAFAAGIIFATVDIAFDCILPSVILHFLNNLASLFWLRYSENKLFVILYVSILATLSLISLSFIYVKRKEYKSLISKNPKSKR